MKKIRNSKGQFTSEGLKGNTFALGKKYSEETRRRMGLAKKGDKSIWWKGGKIKTKCENCGKELFRPPCRLNRGYSFCNMKCKKDWMKGKSLGEKNPHWKGGIIRTKDGYKMINKPNHHRANSSGYVLEHILVLEKALGIKISRKYDIHHLNGIRDDNRPENLVKVKPSEHERNTVRKLLQVRIRELEEKLKLVK